MAEFNIDQMAKEVAEKAMNGVKHGGKTLAEYVSMIKRGDLLELGKDYSSADYKIITEDHKEYQTFKIVKRRNA